MAPSSRGLLFTYRGDEEKKGAGDKGGKEDSS